MARYRPGNLVHIVFDNRKPAFRRRLSDGDGDRDGSRRRGAGLRYSGSREADTPERLKQAVAGALAGDTLTTVVAKVEAIGPKSFHMDLPLLENRFQFKRALEALR